MRRLPYFRRKVRLSRSDLEGALHFIREAGEVESDEPFPPFLLERFVSLVRCRELSYCEIDRRRGEVTFLTGTEPWPAAPGEVYWETLHEHPIRNHRARTGNLRALKIYDFLTPRELRQTENEGAGPASGCWQPERHHAVLRRLHPPLGDTVHHARGPRFRRARANARRSAA